MSTNANDNTDSYQQGDTTFGGCPTCGGNNGYLNVGKGHWFFCDAHRVTWCAGANLFSSWQGETEAEQREKYKRIEDYAEVKPLYPDPRDTHLATAAWHRSQAKVHTDMAEDIEREHGLDPIDVAKHVDAAIESQRAAFASLDDDLPF